ncbi:MAG: DUF58 domain-containing protein [Lachnospira sp.]
MNKRLLSYLLLFLMLFAADVVYIDYGLTIILILMMILPVFLLFYTAVVRRSLTISISCKDKTVIRRAGEECVISFKNTSFFPATDISFTVCCQYNNCPETYTTKHITYVNKLDSSRTTVKLLLEHAGIATLLISDCHISDPCGFFHLKIAAPEKSKIIVYPIKHQPDYRTIYNPLENQYTDSLYSDSVSGDDSSEVFDIHEYKNGDICNRIHWKLSAKSEALFVKDYGFPLGNISLILVEINRAKDREQRFNIDGIYEFVYAVGSIACYRGKEIVIAFYDGESGEMRSVPVITLDKLEKVMYELIALNGNENTPAFQCYLDSDLRSIPRLIYVSSIIDDKITSYAELTSDKDISIYCVEGQEDVFALKDSGACRINRDEILQELQRVMI